MLAVIRYYPTPAPRCPDCRDGFTDCEYHCRAAARQVREGLIIKGPWPERDCLRYVGERTDWPGRYVVEAVND